MSTKHDTNFTGFTPETTQFLWGLALNNEKPWFEAHRAEYEEHLLRPFKALSYLTAEGMERLFPETGLNLHISRIYRDARRLFGRGPFKDHLWFSLKGDQALLEGVTFWFEVGAADYSYGLGFYGDSPRDMAAFRELIDREPRPLAKLARQFNKQEHFILEGDDYARPKGDPGELLRPWYNKKYFSLIHRRPAGGRLYEQALAQDILEGFEFLMPWYRYLSLVHIAD